MEFTPRDYVALITSEHRNKPKFAALVSTTTGYFSAIAAVAASIPDLFDVDTAVGNQLDIDGLWVGQPRVVPSIITSAYFGFLIATGGSEGDASGVGFAAAEPFGEEGVPSTTAGLWCEEGSAAAGAAALTDPVYRTMIYARIERNQYGGTVGELIAAIQTIIPGSVPTITDPGTRAVTIHIGRALTATEESLLSNLDILPRPAGVSYAITS